MKKMQISLVVSTYNRPDALALVLRSALRQRLVPQEIVVADDGSGGETRAVVEEAASRAPFPVRHCWHEDRGFRLSEIRNRAIAQSRGDYLVMVDGDLVLEPSFLADHARASRPGRMVQGGRVLLSEAVTRDALARGRIEFGPFERGTRNRKNAVRSRWLSRLASHDARNVYRVRGANLAFWREDALRVNGFDEQFVGWGREDSEFVARMQHSGVRRLQLKFAAVAFHLWHPEASRALLPRNQEILERTLTDHATRCELGVARHLQGG